MTKPILKLGILFLIVFLSGCSTPAGMKWHKKGNSVSRTNTDIHDCKVNTAMWWPFDDLTECMERRGYELTDENQDPKP